MAQLNPKEMQQALAKPFAPEDLEWRLQNTIEEKMRGLAVPYVTNRAIQNRLDEVCGPENWYNDFKPWHSNGKKEAQLCGIAIYFEGRGFITKWDGAEDSDIEAVKGGLSDSMKRAAVQWGIGRVLYDLNTVWVEIEKRGRSFVIKDSERAIQFLVVLPRIAYIPHTGAVDHGGLSNFGEDLFLGLTLDEKTQVDPLASLHQRRKPAGANRGGVTVARDIEISMIHVVYDDVVTAFCIHRGGRENVKNGGGACFKLTEIRLFLAKEHPLQKRLLFDLTLPRLFFLSGLLWNCFCSFFRFFLYLHRLTPHKCRERPLSYRKRPPADAHAGWFSCSKSHRAA